MYVGLTGGIGSGKSTFAGMLAQLGAVVIDADALARTATEDLAEHISQHFGISLLPDGRLDRVALAGQVFNDPAKLAWLESVVHPRVAELARAARAAAPKGAVVVYDVALLAEKNMAPQFDRVIVVTAPPELRVSRLVQRGLTEADARARMATQATDDQRIDIADIVVDNSSDRDALQSRAQEVFDSLTA